MSEQQDLGADVAAVAFAGSSAIGLPASILDAFDAAFGTDGPDRDSDSVGRGAGCDDCASNVRLRAEHRVFVERVIRAFLGRETAELAAIGNQCASAERELNEAWKENARFGAALNAIASWAEGETVDGSFDEPASARIAREALVGYHGNQSVSEADRHGAQRPREEDPMSEQKIDLSAALLPGEASAAVNTEPLPNKIKNGIEFFDTGLGYEDCQCARCGSSCAFLDCDNCGGEGEIEDSDWQCEGEYHRCDWCRGTGGWWRCLSGEQWCKDNPRPGREDQPVMGMSRDDE